MMARSTGGGGLWRGVGAAALVLAAAVCGEGGEPLVLPKGEVGARVTLGDSAAARAIVRHLEAHLRRAPDRRLPSAGQAVHFVREAGVIESELAADHGRVAGRARVMLPVRADGALRLQDLDSGMTIEVAVEDALPVAAEVAGDYVVYPQAEGGGGHVVYRVFAQGAEDYLTFDSEPPAARANYRLTLGVEVAGLRLVENVLELVDAAGAPRLRMAAPYVVDRRGATHGAVTTIHGCAYDVDSRGPWGRAVVSPGASSCQVRVSWAAPAADSYPLVLDPLWTTTATMVEGHLDHSTSVLADGRVLVAGGQSVSGAELYDPETHTWAVTGSMAQTRFLHTASVSSDGSVVAVAGLETLSVFLSTAELYEPGTGSWVPIAELAQGRCNHTATVLEDGQVLVAGGTDGGVLSSAELYDPVGDAWVPTASLLQARKEHSASALAGGQVLVAGGADGGSLASAELYDPGAGSWSPAASMPSTRSSHTATLLADGEVLLVGGFGGVSTMLYDPLGASWSTVADLSQNRDGHTASLLPNGKVLVAGGWSGGTLSGAELYDPLAGTWTTMEAMAQARSEHTASVLQDGRVLVAGGAGLGVSLSAELFSLTPAAEACTMSAACYSGFCVDGLCCDAACDAPCESCLAAYKDSGGDGECGPVAAGADPDGDCSDDGAATCQLNGLCDGQSSCQSYPVASGCTPEPCTEALACTSEYCVEEICCDAPCAGECEACQSATKGYGDDGVCEPVVAGMSCSAGYCEDGGCHSRKSPGGDCGNDWECLSSHCVDTICCLDPACGAYRCGQGGVCLSSCQSSSDCSPGYACSSDRLCVPPSEVGEEDDGCQVSRLGRHGSSPWPWMLGLLAALGASRRRLTKTSRSAGSS